MLNMSSKLHRRVLYNMQKVKMKHGDISFGCTFIKMMTEDNYKQIKKKKTYNNGEKVKKIFMGSFILMLRLAHG